MLKQGCIRGATQIGNRTWISIIATICADATYLPPAIIYQRTNNLSSSWLKDFKPKEYKVFFTSTPFGFINKDLAYKQLTKVFNENTKRKAGYSRHWRLLQVDSHNSHLNLKFLSWCANNKILVAVFPPHATHRLQPLDVSLFRPFAVHYSQQLERWIYTIGGSFTILQKDFFSLFWPAFQAAFTPSNIISGWGRIDLVLFLPAVVLDQLDLTLFRLSNNSSKSSSISVELQPSDWRKMKRVLYKKNFLINQKLF